MAAFSLEHITARETWRAFAPALHIEDAGMFKAAAVLPVDPARAIAAREHLLLEGYLQESGVVFSVDLAVMAETVRKLSLIHI